LPPVNAGAGQKHSLTSSEEAQTGMSEVLGSMEHLIAEIVKGLVDNKEGVSIVKDEPNEEGVIVYHIRVAPEDMGRVIGKQGRIAKAIRTVVRSAASRTGEKAVVEID